MKIAFAVLALLVFTGGAFSASARPGGGNRYEYVGSFDSSNPFNWDNDMLTSRMNGWASAVIFEVERGNDVQIRNLVIDCHRRPRCFRSRGGSVDKGRGVRVQFRRDLVVHTIRFSSKPNGWSVPPTRVNVYLERSRGNGGGW